MKKVLAVIASLLMVGTMFTACSGNESKDSASSDKLSGSLTLGGSSALQPLAQVAADNLKDKYPELSIIVNAGGSGKGLTDVSNKSVDIGNSDVFAEKKLKEDKAKVLVDHKVCIIGVAPIVNSGVSVTSLTKQQLIDIFTGKVTNWKDVGGSDMKIVIVGRPSSSGTRALFKEKALDNNEEATGSSLQQDDSGILAQTIGQTKGSIGYLALSYTKTKNGIKTLSIDGVEPTYENIYAGKYNVWGYEHMYTNGEPNKLAKAFIDYMKSEEFASTIKDMGYGDASKVTEK